MLLCTTVTHKGDTVREVHRVTYMGARYRVTRTSDYISVRAIRADGSTVPVSPLCAQVVSQYALNAHLKG